MSIEESIEKISDNTYRIPRAYREDMGTDAYFYTSEKLFKEVLKDRSLEQLVNITTLEGIRGHAHAMPDIHEGYGFPIGGVAATDYEKGVISPGGVGYDINCGVRMLISDMSFSEAKNHLPKLADELFVTVPSGVGSKSVNNVSGKDLDNILNRGLQWTKENGYATSDDIARTEEGGAIKGSSSGAVGKSAKERGAKQLGTLGAGNHFLEIDKVVEIIDSRIAAKFGLFKGQITIAIHCGSRGLGHQVCEDYLKLMEEAMSRYEIKVPDKELACVPLRSKEGQNYLAAMSAAANFAWANRQMIAHLVRNAWQKIFGKGKSLNLLYDMAHNMAKTEEHMLDGKMNKLCVHRKGAAHSLGPENIGVTEAYRQTGQPVITPGSMGTASYILVGTRESEKTFNSICHGAGRVMSRARAKKIVWGKDLRSELEKSGILIRSKSNVNLAEEAPFAYKDIDEVVNVVENINLAKRVAKVMPVAVIKG